MVSMILSTSCDFTFEQHFSGDCNLRVHCVYGILAVSSLELRWYLL